MWGAIGMLVLFVIVPLVVTAGGWMSVSAQGSWGPVDSLFSYASTRSIAFHASSATNPVGSDSTVLAEALPHYREMCVVCHSAPGLKRSEIAEGLNPPAPDLASARIRHMSDGELFWVIAHGVRSTGMPAFEKADDVPTRWKIVSFVRHLPSLTAAEREQLKEEDSADHHSEE